MGTNRVPPFRWSLFERLYAWWAQRVDRSIGWSNLPRYTGAVVLAGVLALALVRAWLVASQRKSTVYVWPALVLVLLVTTSVTESYLLFEAGLMLFVMSVMAASRNRSWRQLLSAESPRSGPPLG